MADNEDNITKIERLPILVSDSKGTVKLLWVAKLQVGVESKKILVNILPRKQ